MQFTDTFIRDSVLPAIAATGGATVLTSPYGMPPSLLVMDEYQPPTWVVGMGVEPVYVSPSLHASHEAVAFAANFLLESLDLNSWSAVGFWVDGDNLLVIEPVETYTHHGMALQAAMEHNQSAIYAMHTGEVEWVAADYVVGADS